MIKNKLKKKKSGNNLLIKLDLTWTMNYPSKSCKIILRIYLCNKSIKVKLYEETKLKIIKQSLKNSKVLLIWK